MNWDLNDDYLLDELGLEPENLDDDEFELFPEFDEDEYLQDIKDYIDYMRSIDRDFDEHCKELENLVD